MLSEIITLLLAIPVGYLISWFARDELLTGRGWFFILAITSFILAAFFLFIKNSAIAFALFFLTIIAFISYKKSFDKKWAKRPKI